MARFPRRAALLALLALSSVSLSEAGLASGSQCQVGNSNVFFDKCRADGCCPKTTTVGSTQQTKLIQLNSAGEATNCCSDSQPNCGTGLTCCGYGTTNQAENIDWTGSAEPGSSCIDESIRQCCQYRVMVDGTTPSLKYARKTFNPKTHKCCADAIVHQDYWTTTDFPLVKIGQECNFSPSKFGNIPYSSTASSEWKRQKQNSARCATDADCERGGRSGTCCRRAQWTTDASSDAQFLENREDAYGTCIDSGMACCAGSGAPVQVDAGTTTSSTSATVALTRPKNAQAYDPSVDQCCSVNGDVQDIDIGCPCDADNQCNQGGTCCLDEQQKNSRECSATCTRNVGTESASGTAPGCTGTCTVPGIDTCWGCGGNLGIVTVANRRNRACCDPTTSDRHLWVSKPNSASYSTTSENCCPAGRLGSTSSITGSTCACWSDSDCQGGWTCCNTEGADKATSYHDPPGRCIDPKVSGCCAVQNNDRRQVYTLSTQQCCPMSGPESIGNDCACKGDGDCRSGHTCCKDAESRGGTMGLPSADGKCIHSETQECCDDPNKREGTNAVSVCFSIYEKCCNGQCCNKELDSCRKADWAVGEIGGRTKTKNVLGVQDAHFKEEHERCQKRMTPAIVFFAWVLPVFLTIFGLAALLGAIKVAFDAAMAERGVKSLRVALIVMAALAHICLTLMLWSMFWQIAIFAMGCNIFIIAVIKSENPFARRMGMLVAFLITVIIVSPYTNNFFSFGVVPQLSSSNHHGLQSALMFFTNDFRQCGEHYQWFTSDQLSPHSIGTPDDELIDGRQHMPRYHTWGLCTWEWQQAVAVIGGLYICFQILFSMAAFAIFSRRMNQAVVSKIVAE